METPDPAAAAGLTRSRASPAVCVTGATGFIASWLVRSLLRRGYRVHATVRDASKASWLVSKLGGEANGLKIFEADLNEDGSFDAAVKGCQFVLHVAASMEFDVSSLPEDDDIEEQVRARILEPAMRGAVNVLQACASSGSVRRVVFTSSVSTITSRDDDGWRLVVDESSVVSTDRVWKTKPRGWVYVLSKLLTEEKAFQFAREKGIDLVSIIPPTVGGPFLTPAVPASLRVLLSPVTGDPQFHPVLLSVNSRLGSIPLVHVEDVCDAHIFLMEAAGAQGRYLCSAASSSLPHLTRLLSKSYHPDTSSSSSRSDEEEDFSKTSARPVISSERLTKLGFEFKHGVGDIIEQSVECCVRCGFLK